MILPLHEYFNLYRGQPAGNGMIITFASVGRIFGLTRQGIIVIDSRRINTGAVSEIEFDEDSLLPTRLISNSTKVYYPVEK